MAQFNESKPYVEAPAVFHVLIVNRITELWQLLLRIPSSLSGGSDLKLTRPQF